MMNIKTSRRGSALLIALVIVILTAGVGGAFLTAALSNSSSEVKVVEADEALTMCDAGMERARHALGIYAGTKSWSMNDILAYCGAAYQAIDASATWKDAPNPRSLLTDYKLAMKSDFFKAYVQRLGTTDTTGLNVRAPGAPTDPTKPVSTDMENLGVVFGWAMPFHRGSIYIHVRNNAADPQPYVDTDNQILVTVTATLPSGMQRQIEGSLKRPVTQQQVIVDGLAAVVSLDKVSTLGNIVIDGRDYDYAGTTVKGNGVLGILSGGTIDIGGSSAVGGVGIAPPKSGIADGSIKDKNTFTSGYPASPDEGVNLPAGTLKSIAQLNGTYFTSEAAFNAMLTANGGKMPDHAVVYADFAPSGGSFDMGSGNTKSSMLIVHTDSGTGTIKNLHGNFTGAIMADSIIHVNAGTKITGMVQLFSPTSSDPGNVFGNGTSDIHFSSEALADLVFQATNPNSPYVMSSYRKLN